MTGALAGSNATREIWELAIAGSLCEKEANDWRSFVAVLKEEFHGGYRLAPIRLSCKDCRPIGGRSSQGCGVSRSGAQPVGPNPGPSWRAV
jgi:hypothetical protein